MEWIVSENWIEVYEECFNNFVSSVDFYREGYGGGIGYIFREGVNKDKQFGFKANNGKFYLNPFFYDKERGY